MTDFVMEIILKHLNRKCKKLESLDLFDGVLTLEESWLFLSGAYRQREMRPSLISR
jgi:hypothetical protein